MQAYVVPFARKLSEKEQSEVNYYRHLRERFHEGPYYSVLDTSSSSAKKGSAARANFDPFHGMPSWSGRYQKKRRTLPKIANIGREYGMFFAYITSHFLPEDMADCILRIETRYFPRELWQTIMPHFRPNASIDGYHTQTAMAGMKRGFEDEDEEDDGVTKRHATGAGEDEGEGDVDEGELLEGDEEAEEEIVDDDFEDDEDDMGGDYNAEQYFDAGDDEFGDDGFADGGGGGGDEDTY